MISEQTIQELSGSIAQKFNPEQIILFGSYAWGSPTDRSDVDLLVVMPYRGSPLSQAAAIARTFRVPFAVDVIVRSRDELRQRVAWNDWFIREILDRGRTLYAADHR
ncbi:MAG TPA: nucleotidyltransferase domain-containing protein [Armatimonadota bacterium]|nr:nucleotidyltransferase domain-containing protein [Armatimonadota bacterium]